MESVFTFIRSLCCLTCFAFCAERLAAEAPAFEVLDGAVKIEGVGSGNPILYDNDGWFDVFDNNYLWAQTSLGAANEAKLEQVKLSESRLIDDLHCDSLGLIELIMNTEDEFGMTIPETPDPTNTCNKQNP